LIIVRHTGEAVSRAKSRVAVVVREGIGSFVRHSLKAVELVGTKSSCSHKRRNWMICKASRGSSRVSRAKSRVTVVVREEIGSFVGRSGEAAE